MDRAAAEQPSGSTIPDIRVGLKRIHAEMGEIDTRRDGRESRERGLRP
jgi:hypothetical protein